ncbi:unnamed protein product, partial [Cuscuta europaea]
MVESELPSQKLEVGQSGGQVSVFRRDPLFSGWFDEKGTLHSLELGDANNGTEDLDFELPFIHQPESDVANTSLEAERHQFSYSILGRMTCGVDLGDVTARHGKESYVPFDVEDGSPNDLKHSEPTGDDRYLSYHDPSKQLSRSPFSVSDVLKTLFFILVWYTFSTFLTL